MPAIEISKEALAILTPQELRRLTHFKHRYTLQSQGFTREEIDRLLFTKWLVQTSRIATTPCVCPSCIRNQRYDGRHDH